MRRGRCAGLTLVEALVGVLILVVGFLALASVSSTSAAMARQACDRLLARQLALSVIGLHRRRPDMVRPAEGETAPRVRSDWLTDEAARTALTSGDGELEKQLGARRYRIESKVEAAIDGLDRLDRLDVQVQWMEEGRGRAIRFVRLVAR